MNLLSKELVSHEYREGYNTIWSKQLFAAFSSRMCRQMGLPPLGGIGFWVRFVMSVLSNFFIVMFMWL